MSKDDTWTRTPDVIRRYFEAHDRRDTETALSAFASDARVFDDGHDYRGVDAIRDWLTRASTQFTYTRTLVDVSEGDPNHWHVRNRLQGDFPGGVVELRYQFRIADGAIAELIIEP